jgi:hypothetical protein
MRVLVATRETQGQRTDDFYWANDGELVLPPLVCDSPVCGCDRSFVGIDSHKATTTAMVAERPDVTPQSLKELVRANLKDGGWLDGSPGDESLVEGKYADTLALYAEIYDFAPGTVLGWSGADVLLARRRG